MRILQVIPAYASYNVFLRELADAAVKAGHPTAVVCGGIPDSVSGDISDEAMNSGAEGVRLLPLNIPRGSNAVRHWIAARALRRLMTEWRADVVHAHFSAGVFSAALALRRGDPWVSVGTFQGLSFPLITHRQKMLVRAAETFAARRFDRIQVLTSDDLEALRRAAPGARAEVQHGYGFGCADRFLDTAIPSTEERLSQRREAALPEQSAVLIFVGRLVAFKGFDLAVRAFWHVKDMIPQARLVVLGEADPLHPTGLTAAEWDRYQQDRAIVRAGVQHDVLPWLDLADLMLFPTEREGMPVCVMEALARGLPVVTAPVRGCRELVVDGDNGYLIADRAVSTWVGRLAAVIRTLSAAEPRHDRRSAHRFAQPFTERFRRSLWVADTLAGYRDAIAARDSARSSLGAPQRSRESVG